MNYKTIISKLKSHKNPKNIAGMAQFGISAKNTLGVNIPIIRSMAKEIGKDHNLALELWGSKIHEARILASMIDEPSLVGKKQMEH
ncbi:DNA alkylation repair protein [Patescibacteria group bacterium]|nr:DNA alkylation repair protein [Patescibacteria group bacterium]